MNDRYHPVMLALMLAAMLTFVAGVAAYAAS